ncbi:ATP synthase subunit gamma [Campylobacter concisus]|jgi:ATP synthase F1, gamma subunit|uniref:ATP synthase gamma chain n=4 Tax=Campylobacter concisus TaxID=199 RepID=ATPG_CAMC1|nr:MULTISPECIES: ATP synthase F1 subunit gamma [Campylobacter]A7ZC36.1 RecName: Full=ATP synthase gamma chain; AltName: Full=ATP synthase F1 sector gamma subunit; AltName: Full=F-ATPase gamma subunit [Campylobacter concisus 13826]RKV88939.1 MAG: F0F1 ATP synthase subunit gamma [Campylobacter sp.]ALF47159.1 ATP synthase, F1 complex, gamma subunit [Campylobacter concisus]AVX43512.1 ATP synthase gamma chain [Campylobacter concisus]EAT97462.1 ATP synthase, F1 complex, gamma subunit [Campylobacter 
MSNLKDIKRKIKSVQNTQKTTRAMKLVSTAKLRKAEEAARYSRVYALKINEVLSEIAYKINQYASVMTESKFFNTTKSVEKVDIIFVTADKGLCGGFNVQTIKTVRRMIDELKAKKIKVRLRAVGKKGIEFFNFQGVELLETYVGASSSPTYEKAQKIIKDAIDDFTNGITDKVVLIHNGYKNMISQEIRVNDIVPIEPSKIVAVETNSLMEFEPEDNYTKIMDELLNKYFEYSMYYALVDSLAAEHSARMQAMDNATNNAKQRVKQLNLAYNKARQESITTELIEIISGVESMK